MKIRKGQVFSPKGPRYGENEIILKKIKFIAKIWACNDEPLQTAVESMLCNMKVNSLNGVHRLVREQKNEYAEVAEPGIFILCDITERFAKSLVSEIIFLCLKSNDSFLQEQAIRASEDNPLLKEERIINQILHLYKTTTDPDLKHTIVFVLKDRLPEEKVDDGGLLDILVGGNKSQILEKLNAISPNTPQTSALVKKLIEFTQLSVSESSVSDETHLIRIAAAKSLIFLGRHKFYEDVLEPYGKGSRQSTPFSQEVYKAARYAIRDVQPTLGVRI